MDEGRRGDSSTPFLVSLTRAGVPRVSSVPLALRFQPASGRLQAALRGTDDPLTVGGGRRSGTLLSGTLLRIAGGRLGGTEEVLPAGGDGGRCGRGRRLRRRALLSSLLLNLAGGWLEVTGLGCRAGFRSDGQRRCESQHRPNGQNGGEGGSCETGSGVRHALQADDEDAPGP